MAGELSFDFYLEVASAAVPGGNKEAFANLMKARGSTLLENLLQSLHAHLSPMPLRVALPLKCTFVHFGSLVEYPYACALVASREGAAGSYSPGAQALLLNCQDVRALRLTEKGDVLGEVSTGEVNEAKKEDEIELGSISVVENCRGCSLLLSPGAHVIAGLRDLRLSEPLPAGMCLDGRLIAQVGQPVARRQACRRTRLRCLTCGTAGCSHTRQIYQPTLPAATGTRPGLKQMGGSKPFALAHVFRYATLIVWTRPLNAIAGGNNCFY
ncbi:hypothetical protein T492DRAFT_114657 [Pavlovales sp. CCMP2436]|nr:hypothetical protein T492DRAFT_114657 [Pavlovales sp. CCMP2436]